MKPTLRLPSPSIVVRSLLAFALALAFSVPAHATLPISGNTLDFGAGNHVGSPDLGAANVVAAGDLDGDGDLDVVSGQSSVASYEVILWENDGTPFTDAWPEHDLMTIAGTVSALAVGDLDGDGDLDVVTGLSTFGIADVVAWQNDGTPFDNAWAQTDVGTVGNSVNSVALGDLDRDGDLDIVEGSDTNEILAWQNDDTPFTGSWTSQSVGTLAISVRAVALADLDSDGWLDLASGTYVDAGSAEVKVWRNDATPFSGSWAATDVGNSTGAVYGLAAGDLDSDGHPDLITGSSNLEDYELIAWESDGTPFNGGWTQHDAAMANSFLSLGLADLDGDGDLDAFGGTVASLGAVFAWQNDGTPFTGTWAQTDVGSPADNAWGVAAGDLDGDGDLDLVSGDGGVSGNVTAWPNAHVHRNAAFTSTGLDFGPTGDTANGLAVGDLDNDGDPDVVTGGSSGTVLAWRNDGTPFTGTWANGSVGTSADDVTSVALGDLDGDGNLDIVTGSLDGEDFEVIAWENDGTPFNGGWTQVDVGTPFASILSVALADLDNDGDLDVIAGSVPNALQDEVNAWQNDGTPFNTSPWAGIGLGVGIGVSDDDVNALAIGDLDRDGLLDVVYGTGSAEDFEVIAIANDGTPFSGALWFAANIGASADDVNAIAVGDLDRDGHPDVVTGSSAGEDFELIAWQGNSDPFAGGWTQNDLGATADDVNALALGDLDADGDPDLVTGSGAAEDNELSLWRNDGSPFTGGWTQIEVGPSADAIYSVALSDLQGDGDLDILSGSGLAEDNEFIGWRNNGGSAALAVTDTAPDLLGGAEDDALKIVFSHNGIAGDANLELNSLGLFLARDDCTTALTDPEAAALLGALRVRLDDGDNVFEATDTLVAEVITPTLSSGILAVPFTDNDANVQVAVGASKTYWVSLAPAPEAAEQDPASLCLSLDPDSASLVEAKGSDYSVSIQNTTPVNTGALPIARLLYLPLALNS